MKKINFTVSVGILSALSFLLMFVKIPIFTSSFLKLELSDVPALFGALAYGLSAGIAIQFIKNLLDWLLVSSETVIPIGNLANFVAGVLYIVPVYLFYKKYNNRKGIILGSVFGTLIMTFFMSLLNYYYFLPLYAKYLQFDVENSSKLFSYISVTIVPFNLVKGILISTIVIFLLPRTKRILRNK